MYNIVYTHCQSNFTPGLSIYHIDCVSVCPYRLVSAFGFLRAAGVAGMVEDAARLCSHFEFQFKGRVEMIRLRIVLLFKRGVTIWFHSFHFYSMRGRRCHWTEPIQSRRASIRLPKYAKIAQLSSHVTNVSYFHCRTSSCDGDCISTAGVVCLSGRMKHTSASTLRTLPGIYHFSS